MTLRRWPCLLHPYTSVGRGSKRSRDIVRKTKRVGKFALVSWSIWLMCHHWSGWARWDERWTNISSSIVRLKMLTLPISPLWPLAPSEESWQLHLFYFIYLESDTFIVVSCAKILDALGSVWSKIQIRILTYGIRQSRIMPKSPKAYILILSIA